jgi:hypothetical protein
MTGSNFEAPKSDAEFFREMDTLKLRSGVSGDWAGELRNFWMAASTTAGVDAALEARLLDRFSSILWM